MIITPKFDEATGHIDTDTEKLHCVSNFKNKTVYIGVRATGSIVCLARVKLHSTDRMIDASETFNDAVALGNEIARRWNLVAEENTARKERLAERFS